ncbi:MAG: FtsX-like permease family protein [Devosia sp.]
MTALLEPPRLLPLDILRLALYGLRARPLRVVLSALGIAIGIAAMMAVVGISTSSRAQLNQLLSELGTNLLSAGPGKSMLGEAAIMPPESIAMIGRIEAVESVSAIGSLADAKVYRNDHIPKNQSGGIAVFLARLDLLGTVSAKIAAGSWLNEATSSYPTVVLGARAAARLGIGSNLIGQPIWLGGRWFTIVGILAPVSLVPGLDLAALIGWPAGERYLGADGDITTIFVRARPASVDAVRSLLARTANPEHPNEVEISRPSDALAAEAATDVAFTGLLLGLGAVALLVGGIGVANTMVISVLERRAEIGLRRSQGATRGHIRAQFFGEALMLALLGGGSGLVVGWLVTAGYARLQGWPVDIPLWVPAAGLVATMMIGAIAGLYPAIRAARLAPTEALTAT